MANLVSLMLHCKEKGEAAIIGSNSHICYDEKGGISAFGGVYPIVAPNLPDGTIELDKL